jgi:histone deacetylase 6
MEYDDFAMEEDNIMASTEPNGNHVPDTVDPSEIFGTAKGPPLAKKEQLPFHSPSKSSTLLQPNAQNGNSGFNRSARSPSGRSEGMNISRLSPARRSSPKVCIPPKPRASVLPYASSKTGLVYDARMRFHAELPDMSTHPDDIHPEDPRRIHSIFEEIRQAGLVGSDTSEENEREDHCWRIATRFATRPEILLIHTEEHYDFVESLQSKCVSSPTKHS